MDDQKQKGEEWQMADLINGNVQIWIVGNMVMVTILIIAVIYLWVKIARDRQKYAKMMNGLGVQNLEEVIIQMQHRMNDLKSRSEKQEEMQIRTTDGMKKMKARVGICRYNAFADQGSDLSFSVAFVDEYQDGVVISGIHNRDETYIYAKPLQKGQSEYTLSPEEKEAINQALKTVQL